MKNAFKKSDEEGGVLPVQRTKKPFVPKSIFESFKSSPNIGDRKIFVGGLGQVSTLITISTFISVRPSGTFPVSVTLLSF